MYVYFQCNIVSFMLYYIFNHTARHQMHCFLSNLQLDIRGVLKGYTATDYYYEYAKFVPYLLDDAVIGSVSCSPAKTNFDYSGLLPFIAAAASNTTVLAEGFANFLPTAAIEFHFENILTWKQVKDTFVCTWSKASVDKLV